MRKIFKLLATVMILGFALHAMAQVPPGTPPTVSIQTELGAAPVAPSTVLTTTADAGTTSFPVKLVPPAGAALTITFAPPDVTWRAARDGSWSGQLSAVTDREGHTVLVDLSSAAGVRTGLIRLDTATTQAGTMLDIAVMPQSGWIGDLIDDILTTEFCEAYLDAHQFPSHSPSPTVWDYCREKLGL